MQGITIEGLDELDSALERVLKKAPSARRQLHEEIADMLKKRVDKNIAASVNDSHGHVRSWQEKVVGSGGGYAAVRPSDDSYTDKYDNEGITALLEQGHKIRKRVVPLYMRWNGTAKRARKSRAKVAYVDGRHFYESAAAGVESEAIALAEAFVDKLAKELGG